MAPVIETKVAAGSFTGILAGLITWALTSYVPAFRSGLPPAVAALIPVAVGWLAHSVAAYAAPHTPREMPQQISRTPSTRVVVPPSTGPAVDPPVPGIPGIRPPAAPGGSA